MDSENQELRASRMASKLPAPPPRQHTTGRIQGLAEMSDAQNNARPQFPLAPPQTKALKREVPQPAAIPQAKRKPLSEQAASYGTGSNIPAVTLVKAARSGIKPPSSTSSTSARPGSRSGFGKSIGPGARPTHTRSKTISSGHGQSVNGRLQRPQTSLGHRQVEDEPAEDNNAFDVDGRLGHIEQHFQTLKGMMGDAQTDRTILVETMEMYKTRVAELQQEREKIVAKNEELQTTLFGYRDDAANLKRQLDDAEWKHRSEMEQVKRSSEHARDDLQRSIDAEVERLRKSHQEELEALKRHYAVELEDERREKTREVQELRLRLGNEQQDLNLDLQKKDREISDMRCQLEKLKGDLDREATLKNGLQTSLAELSAANMTMEGKMNSLRSQLEFLESDSKAQSDSFSAMEARLQEANRLAEEARQKLIKEETERRVLFNKYQELKGNIRVMCRVRPVLNTSEGDEANLSFPDEKTSAKIGVLGPEEKSSLGNVNRKEYPFEFDRVFDPAVQNEDIFGEISQLVQSALDGYNVCIFCYGQTGSGKTYTMSSPDGMIPRATHMIYETITKLKEKSWTYSMVGSFVEVYNEELHDLLTPNGRDDGKKKLEIKHDETKKTTTVTNCKTVSLNSADSVETMLNEAQNNRSVAATKANERSSRSHSVFILRLVGENSATGERCEGTLNLVDLAGSERVKHSGAEGDRMKEAQNINKSLSCLGDVIDALGRGTSHVPYRNSKLTHLLQYSLGGNSKTLMFVMVSPLEAHLKETLTSLRFAAKVHTTHIGTAKSTKKIKGGDS